MYTMTHQEALEFRTGYEMSVRMLSRKSRRELALIEEAALAGSGMRRVFGGPGAKDELISAILGYQFPLDRLNETTHILYHQQGESWSACEWCHPHDGGTCDCKRHGQ